MPNAKIADHRYHEKKYPEYWMAFFTWDQPTLFRKNKARDTPDVEKKDLLIFL